MRRNFFRFLIFFLKVFFFSTLKPKNEEEIFFKNFQNQEKPKIEKRRKVFSIFFNLLIVTILLVIIFLKQKSFKNSYKSEDFEGIKKTFELRDLIFDESQLVLIENIEEGKGYFILLWDENLTMLSQTRVFYLKKTNEEIKIFATGQAEYNRTPMFLEYTLDIFLEKNGKIPKQSREITIDQDKKPKKFQEYFIIKEGFCDSFGEDFFAVGGLEDGKIAFFFYSKKKKEFFQITSLVQVGTDNRLYQGNNPLYKGVYNIVINDFLQHIEYIFLPRFIIKKTNYVQQGFVGGKILECCKEIANLLPPIKESDNPYRQLFNYCFSDKDFIKNPLLFAEMKKLSFY